VRRVALILVVVAGGAATTAAVSGGGTESGYRIDAIFDTASFLTPGQKVTIAGAEAGRVDELSLTPDRRARVTLVVDERFVPFRSDGECTIQPQSLIGERYVQLFPAWKEGEAKIADGATIPESRTSVPVEPDEALAALKRFIDTLDPEATGKLVSNLAADLKGAGGDLNRAVSGLADVATTVASKDAEIARIIDNFDDFTSTLRTREAQLGTLMDQFAKMTSIIADERRSIEGLVKGLGQVSGDALDLVSAHGAKLDTDLRQLTRALATVDANLQSVSQVLDAGPVLATGLIDAYDPQFRRNRERVARDAEREHLILEWDLGDEPE